MTALRFDETFATPFGQVRYLRNADNSVPSGNISNASAALFSYQAATSSFRIANLIGIRAIADANPTISFATANRVAASSDARQTTYRQTVDGYEYQITLLNPGSGNDLLALTYSSLGVTRQSGPSTSGSINVGHAFAWGFGTPSTAVPPTGTQTYRGIITGEAFYLSSTSNTPVYRISGTLNVTVNFADGSNSGTLVLLGTDDRTGGTVELGTFDVTLSGGTLVLNGGGQGRASGNAAFQYYGPAAEELAGAAAVQLTGSPRIPSVGGQLFVAIAFAAKR